MPPRKTDDFVISKKEIEALLRPARQPRSLKELFSTKNPVVFADRLMLLIGERSADYANLPPLSRLSVALNAFRLESSSGGIGQFLLNSDPELIADCLRFLKTVGATKTRATLVKAIKLFPDGKVPPRQSERDRVLRKLEKQKPVDPLRLLERDLRLCGECIEALLQGHLAARKAKLAKETGLA